MRWSPRRQIAFQSTSFVGQQLRNLVTVYDVLSLSFIHDWVVQVAWNYGANFGGKTGNNAYWTSGADSITAGSVSCSLLPSNVLDDVSFAQSCFGCLSFCAIPFL
jgi:hypothetical protein